VEITYIFSPNHYGAIFEHTGLESLSPKGVEIARRTLTSVDIASVAAEEKLASELAEATSLEKEEDEPGESNIASDEPLSLEPKPTSEDDEFYDDDVDADQFDKSPDELNALLEQVSKSVGENRPCK